MDHSQSRISGRRRGVRKKWSTVLFYSILFKSTSRNNNYKFNNTSILRHKSHWSTRRLQKCRKVQCGRLLPCYFCSTAIKFVTFVSPSLYNNFCCLYLHMIVEIPILIHKRPPLVKDSLFLFDPVITVETEIYLHSIGKVFHNKLCLSPFMFTWYTLKFSFCIITTDKSIMGVLTSISPLTATLSPIPFAGFRMSF